MTMCPDSLVWAFLRPSCDLAWHTELVLLSPVFVFMSKTLGWLKEPRKCQCHLAPERNRGVVGHALGSLCPFAGTPFPPLTSEGDTDLPRTVWALSAVWPLGPQVPGEWQHPLKLF